MTTLAQLNGLERSIAKSAARNRLLLRGPAREQFQPTVSQNGFNKTLRKLVDLDVLASHRVQLVPDAKSYLTLGRRGCELTGAPASYAKPIAPQDLPDQLAAYAVCSLSRPYRKRLLSAELLKQFPSLAKRYHTHPWLVEYFEKRPVLVQIRSAITGACSTTVGKLVDQVTNLRTVAEFARQIERSGLMYLLVAATKEKAIALEAAFREHPDFITPRQPKAYSAGCAGCVRVCPVYFPPLDQFAGDRHAPTRNA